MLAQISSNLFCLQKNYSRFFTAAYTNDLQNSDQKSETFEGISKSENKNPTEAKKEPTNEQSKSAIQELEAEIARLQEENKKIKNDSLYLAADLANARRIFQEEMNAMRDLAVFKLGSELLPALDNLARIEQVGKKQNMNDILKGIEIIDKQFHDILQRFKIQKLESKGKEFDPKFHTAIATIDFKGKVPSGHIADVPLDGYTIGNKVLRLAKVVVAK